jgi:flagellar basal body L-ring protein FlgH
VVLPVTPADLTTLDAIGWNLASSSPPPPPPPDPEANEPPEPPTLTIANHAITVSKVGSTSLPITVAAVDSDDVVTVTIKGLTRYESITDALDGKVFKGSSVTLTAAEVASGLTLTSSYKGKGTPTNTLTIFARNTTVGEAATSASQTLTVTLSATSTAVHSAAAAPSAAHSAALLTQSLAAGFEQNSGAPMMAVLSSWGGQDEGLLLTSPHHSAG